MPRLNDTAWCLSIIVHWEMSSCPQTDADGNAARQGNLSLDGASSLNATSLHAFGFESAYQEHGKVTRANVSAEVDCEPEIQFPAVPHPSVSGQAVSCIETEGDGNTSCTEPCLLIHNGYCDAPRPNTESVLSGPHNFDANFNNDSGNSLGPMLRVDEHDAPKVDYLNQNSESALFPVSKEMLSQSDFIKLTARQTLTETVAKRMKLNSQVYKDTNDVDFIIKRVADIVLVLSGIGQIRAGRPPASIEKELHAEAYGRLGFVVQQVAPKDIVTKALLEKLIEDLGLRSTEEKVEVVAASVADKMAEEDMRKDEVEQMPNDMDGLVGDPASPLVNRQKEQKDSELSDMKVQASVDCHPQQGLPTPMVSLAQVATLATPELLPSSLPGTDLSVPVLLMKEEDPHVLHRDAQNSCSQEIRPRFEDQGVVSSSANFLAHDSLPRAVAQKQADISGARFTHKQLTQAIQQWIQSRTPLWQPVTVVSSQKPYMSVIIPCEICKILVKDTLSILICDTCERAYHLKCLQPYQLRGIPKHDWYCPKCMIETQGLPQIPKYGPVRPGSTFAVSPGTGRFQGNEGNSMRAEVQTSISVIPIQVINGLPATSVKTETERTMEKAGKDFIWAGSDSSGRIGMSLQVPGQMVKEGGSRHFDSTQHTGGSLTGVIDSVTAVETQPLPSSVAIGQPTAHIPVKRAMQIQSNDKLPYLKSQLEMEPYICLQQAPQVIQSGTSRTPQSSGRVLGKEESQIRLQIDVAESLSSPQSMKTLHAEVGGGNAVAASGSANLLEHQKMTDVIESGMGIAKGSGQDESMKNFGEDGDQFGVEWMGDPMNTFEGKAFYSACHVGGFLYKLQDYALFRPETPDIPPYIARLQVLWEDITTSSKWVRVNWCYYPTDIPMMVGRPSNPEANEVYESNHGDNNLVGSIQGPCLVLRPDKYFKEIERRRELLRSGHTSEGLFPIFLCRWLYDAPRGVFTPATDLPVII